MTINIDRDYRYLLTNLIPLHRLSARTRKYVRTALAGDDFAGMRSAAVTALQELYQSRYFDHTRTQIDNGTARVTYVKNDGSYQIQLTLPSPEWQALGAPSETAEDTKSALAAVEKPIETTINVLPEIIRSFSIDGERESPFQRLESVLKFVPHWFRFTSARLLLVEEKMAQKELGNEYVILQRERAFQEKVVYQRCRHSKRTAVLDAAGARSMGISPPDAVANRGLDGANASLAISPVFSNEDFWGVLEVWSIGDRDEPLFRERVETARGMIEQIIENTVHLENLTSVDWLTGLYNRQFYDRLVRIEIERAMRSGSRLALLVADIDNFKSINDTIGHRKGDEALVVVADLLRVNLRKIDLPFRYGGEEFVILLPGTGEVEAIHTAERLRVVIAEYREFLDEQGQRRPITVSIGGAVFPEDARTEEELFRRADGALFIAKRKGKNKVEFYHE